jgi:hypothetical protein
MTVAGIAAEHGINLVDIGDEPLYVQEVFDLDERARAKQCSLVIGSGTAPQTTGALLRLVMQRTGPGVDVTLGASFGINRVGPRAVRTALEAIAGVISLPSAPAVWRTSRRVPFGAPFHPVQLRNYPLPETVYVPKMPGVRTSILGAALPDEWQNHAIAFLQRIGFARLAAKTWLATPLTGLIAGVETWMARRHLGGCGIAIFAEASNERASATASFYHPDMTDLTAHALAITVKKMLTTRGEQRWGVQLGHEFMDPQLLLDQLRPLGAEWEIADGGIERTVRHARA